MYSKLKRMIVSDGPRFVQWVEDHYAEAKREGTYTEFDDDEEEQVWQVRWAKEIKNVKQVLTASFRSKNYRLP